MELPNDIKVQRHDRKVFRLCLLGGLPAVVVALVLLFIPGASLGVSDLAGDSKVILVVLILCFWIGFAAAVRNRLVRLFQTIANLLSALREGDFSIRGRARGDDPLSEVFFEINTLGDVLREQRLGAVEMSALLRRVMEEIEVAIFAIDGAGTLRLINPAGAALLGQNADQLLGHSAQEVGLGECMEGDATRVLTTTIFPGGSGRWGMRRSTFRERGVSHSLIVIGELSRALREEELLAWQRLVRVLGHELNNSLAPIKSLAGTLASMLRRDPLPLDWSEDMRNGLEIIATRADSLTRFTGAYASLARLPAPQLASCALEPLIRRVISLEGRLPVSFSGGFEPLTFFCDVAQIEQVLINLVKNAVDAVLEAQTQGRNEGGVKIVVRWDVATDAVELRVIDDGLGVANPGNLFVPFFTTKPDGSGIGLVLCRQIAENHRGSLKLANRTDQVGSVATLRIPRQIEIG